MELCVKVRILCTAHPSFTLSQEALAKTKSTNLLSTKPNPAHFNSAINNILLNEIPGENINRAMAPTLV